MEKYTLGRCLGSGSFADVYLCQDRDTLKIYTMKAAKAAGGTEECQSLVKLSYLPHFGLPVLHESFLHDGRQHIVYEYIEGQTLFDYITAQAKLTRFIPVVPENVIRLVTRQLLFTVRYCHANGIAHQDIKTDNIFLQDSGRVVIIDFGQAYNVELAERDRAAGRAAGVGNLIFLPPEILLDTVNIRTQSLTNLEKLSFNSQQMEICVNSLKRRRMQNLSKTSIQTSPSTEDRAAYIFRQMHYIQTFASRDL